jgi:hypothetical protein
MSIFRSANGREGREGVRRIVRIVESRRGSLQPGRHVSDAEFLIWMATVRLYLTTEEMTIFDHSSKDYSVKEFRAEKAAALAKILWARRGLKVAKANGAIG